jgi:putative membrane protein
MEKDRNMPLWIIIGAFILLSLFAVFGMGGFGMMGFGMGFGLLFMLLFWVVVIWLVVTLVNPVQSIKKDDSDPFTILKQRYAKGEITKKQYEEMKKDLE